MKTTYYLSLFILFLSLAACRKDKEPKERIEISNASYTVNCTNCEQHTTEGALASYSSIKVSFNFEEKNKRVDIGSNSYLRIIWTFSDGSTGDYIVDYNNLSVSGNTISFDSSWRWATTTNLQLAMILYSGEGSKSNTLSVNIPKPVGAAKSSASEKPSFGGF